jgi:hypothetical protein
MMLFWHLPHAEQRAEQVAAPQQDAANDMSVPTLGTAKSGIESKAPIVLVVVVELVGG